MRKLLTSIVGALVISTSAAVAADFPTQPIRILNGFAPGGVGDIISRVIAGPLQERLGQPVVVESMPGGSGIIGTVAVAESNPDGHTLGIFFGSHAVLAATRASLPYDPVGSFQPITNLLDVGLVLSVNAGSPIEDVADFIERAKAQPGVLSFASSGIGTSSHLAGELFQMLSGIELLHVPGTSEVTAIADLMRDEITMTIGTPNFAGARIREGNLRGLGVTTHERWPDLPDVPTVSETLPDYVVTSWVGIMGPANIPADVVELLNREIRDIVSQPEISAQLVQIMGGAVATTTPDEMRERLISQIDRWKTVVQEANIQLQE